MKTLNIYIIALAAFSILLVNREVTAQSFNNVEVVTVDNRSVDCSKSALANLDRPSVNAILERDYPYLSDIKCLKNGYLQSISGTKIKFRNMHQNNPERFVLRGTGKKIDIHAEYDQDGKLIRAEINKKDVALPSAIRQYIFEAYNGWTITGNEMVVKNFDTQTTEFTVDLKKGNSEQVLYFKNNGSQIQHLVTL